VAVGEGEAAAAIEAIAAHWTHRTDDIFVITFLSVASSSFHFTDNKVSSTSLLQKVNREEETPIPPQKHAQLHWQAKRTSPSL
jgi:hypothetical protein